MPLPGPRARGQRAGGAREWIRSFLDALAAEARGCHGLLRDIERSWLAARRDIAGRRSTSRAPLAVEVNHRSARRLFGLAGMAPLRT